MIQKDVLPNGMKVMSERITHVQSVAVGAWVGCGSRHEEESAGGISHFIEHMMFKGTSRRTAAQLAEEMDAIGGDMNAFTDKEHTCYYARALSEYLPVAVDIIGDMLLHSALPEEELQREKNVVLDEIKRYEDSPDDMVHDLFAGSLWRNHPLGRPVIGTPQSVEGLTRDDLRGYMARHYTTDRTILSVAGNFERDELLPLIERVFGEMPCASAERVEDPPIPSDRETLVEKDTEQVHFCLGTTGFAHT
ncbi:MAG: insulinase family protein, partial [Armatimonadetes bacterium]|nr:insulinase family protein [Armatimonadota bacterium]